MPGLSVAMMSYARKAFETLSISSDSKLFKNGDVGLRNSERSSAVVVIPTSEQAVTK